MSPQMKEKKKKLEGKSEFKTFKEFLRFNTNGCKLIDFYTFVNLLIFV